MLFLAAGGPPRLDHVDSIRFDSQRACESAEKIVRSNALLASRGADLIVSMTCMPAN
jgi:hypothetical protein